MPQEAGCLPLSGKHLPTFLRLRDSRSNPFVGWHAGNVLTVPNNSTTCRRLQTRDRLHQGTFPRAVATDDGHYFTCVDRQADATQSIDSTVVHGQIEDIQYRGHTVSPAFFPYKGLMVASMFRIHGALNAACTVRSWGTNQVWLCSALKLIGSRTITPARLNAIV